MRAMFNVIFVVFLLAGIPGMARDEQAAGDGLHMKPVVWQKEWQLTGFVPGAETSFTAPGLCDGTEYAFRVTAYTEDGRGRASAPLSVQTPAGEHSRKGEVLATSPGRIGGATMMLRKDGSILLYAHYQNRLADQGRFEIHRMVSRDHGRTWSGLEPFMAARDKLMYLRSNTGWYYESRSSDNGATWSPPRQSTVRAPLCPAKLVKLDNGMIGIVFNGIIDPSHQNLSRRWDLATMVSGDGGETWTNCRTLEFADPYAKPKHHLLYCYPSVLFDGDRLQERVATATTGLAPVEH